jgi:hypothetical protein
MGVETPIPPVTIRAAAPEGAPPRRINDLKEKCREHFLLRRTSEALMWGILTNLIIIDFHGSGVNRIGSSMFQQNLFSMKSTLFRQTLLYERTIES